MLAIVYTRINDVFIQNIKKIKFTLFGNMLNWIKVNGVYSDSIYVLSGIPQGECSGPILFAICNLPEPITPDTFLFAEDTKIFRQITQGKMSLHYS